MWGLRLRAADGIRSTTEDDAGQDESDGLPRRVLHVRETVSRGRARVDPGLKRGVEQARHADEREEDADQHAAAVSRPRPS